MADPINYGAWPVTGNTSLTANLGGQKMPVKLGGFLCTTAGTLQVRDGIDNTGRIVIPSVAVTAGQYINFPANLHDGCYVECGGGAAVTALAVF